MEKYMIKDPHFQKQIELIDNAVAFNIANQLKHEDIKQHLRNIQWLTEYCTVEINLGRRTGKSYYINKRATRADLVICMNNEHRRHVFKDCDNIYTAADLGEIMEAGFFYRRTGICCPRDVYWNKVYVDEPQLIFKTKDSREYFFNLMESRCNQIIMLGTPMY